MIAPADSGVRRLLIIDSIVEGFWIRRLFLKSQVEPVELLLCFSRLLSLKRQPRNPHLSNKDMSLLFIKASSGEKPRDLLRGWPALGYIIQPNSALAREEASTQTLSGALRAAML